MSRWFRMYDEVLDDPKVQRLSGDDFKAWVNILCLASRNGGVLPDIADIGFALRLEGKKASAVFNRLVSVGLIVPVEDRFAPNKWNDRQYKSDVSTGRVKRFRERSKTVSETPPDTETDTESTLAKANGAEAPPAPPADSDKAFWDTAKAFLKPEAKGDPGALIGKWARDHGKQETAAAITRAQLERPVQRIPFIEGCFRQSKQVRAAQPVVPL